MGTKLIISEHYKYPSLNEGKKYTVEIPNYDSFKFIKINPLISTLNRELEDHEVNRKNNLYYWNIVFTNKLFKLHETELFVRTHFNRGIQNEILKSNERELVDGIQFIYFVEIYYYFYFSTLGVLAHILNAFFGLGKNENQVKFWDKLFSKIESHQTKQHLKSFYDSIAETRELRNSFTHRFPQNENDYRTTLINIEGRSLLQFSMGKRTKNEEFMQNITESSRLLETLINNLKLELDDSV